jgi:hypothetical protein
MLSVEYHLPACESASDLIGDSAQGRSPHDEAETLEEIGDFIARQVLDKDAVFFDG